MKKKIAILLVIFLMFSVIITSCSENNKPGSGGSVDYVKYSFDSYAELNKALTEIGTTEYSSIRGPTIRAEKLYEKLVPALEYGKLKLVIPKLNGEEIPFFREDWSITLYEKLSFGLPGMRYNLKVGEHELDFTVNYPSILENEEVSSAKTFLEVISIIAPKAPTPSKYNSDSYKRVYEKEIQIANGTNITSLVYEEKDKAGIYINLYIDDMLIVLYSDREIFTDEFWKSFSIDYM